MSMNHLPNCHKCAYFFVTWDFNLPYGCKQFGIKSKQLPSLVVHRNTGTNCPVFSHNTKIKEE